MNGLSLSSIRFSDYMAPIFRLRFLRNQFVSSLVTLRRLALPTLLIWLYAGAAIGAPSPVPLASELDNPYALSVDDGYVYYGELNSSTAYVRRVSTSGGTPETIAQFAAFLDPHGIYRGIERIAFTPTHLYYSWGSYDGDWIEEAAKTGGSRRVVVDKFNGGGLIGVINGYVYYSYNFCCIAKVPIDGSTGPQPVLTSGKWVRSSAYDDSAIYFVEYFSRNVYRFDITTNTVTPLITGNSVEGGVVIDSSNVYYSNGSKILVVSNLGGSVSTLYTGTNVAVRVADSGIVYFTEGNDLKAIPVTGGAATLISSGANVSNMVQDSNDLYWSDLSGGSGAGVLEQLSKVPGVVQTSQIPPRSATPILDLFASLGTTTCKRSAVVLVHGWNSEPSAWATSLAQKIADRIAIAKSQGLMATCETWDIKAYDWKERAGQRFPHSAFSNAYAEGTNLGKSLANEQWDHIHFIAHSAGSNLIQTAFEQIVALGGKPPTVQMTFLDAYYPESADGDNRGAAELWASIRYDQLRQGKSTYGFGATWAEQYVDRRDTYHGALVNTNRVLPLAINYDVTQIDTTDTVFTWDAHSWPYRWYSCIYDSSDCPHNPFLGNTLWGPKVSLEYGLHQVSSGAGQVCTLVTGLEDCTVPPSTSTPTITLTPVAAQLNLDRDLQTTISLTGQVDFNNSGSLVTLHTGSPVWVSFVNSTTQSFDSIQFDYRFLSNAKGLLSVYVDDQQIFLAEEIDADPGIHMSPLIPVGPIAPGLHSLSIRLDPQSDDQSNVEISNLQTSTRTIEQVQNQAPIPIASGPASARKGSWIALDGTASYDPDKFPRPLGYSWKQVSGPTATLSDWYSAAPTFVASQPGQYTFTLTVTDGPAFATSSEVNITVPILGDIDGDSDVDNNDLAKITSALNTKANGPNDLRDINGDGMITALDARKLVTLCTRARCATH